MGKVCYNCGKTLDKSNKTVEHIPAKTLYEGFSHEYKKNRITVPACFDCNNQYSKIDQEIRDALAVTTDNKTQRPDILSKGIKNITRNRDWKDRVKFSNDGQSLSVIFNYGKLRDLHIKNFKALFFRKYGVPVPTNFKIEIVADGDDENRREQAVKLYAIAGEKFEPSGHSDIFKFVLKGFSLNGNDDDKIKETDDVSKTDYIIGTLVYHEELAVVVSAATDKFLSYLPLK